MRCSVLSILLLLAGSVRAADVSPPEGFVALFNGKDLDGWKGLVADPPKRAKMSPEELGKAQAEADRRMREHWRVEDGVLVFDGKGDSLCTAKDHGDFELLVDWKILKDGDSGIYLRGSPQVQIWDRPEGSGGLFNNQRWLSKPLLKADRPVGEWNTFRIAMVGERVWIWLNDELVVNDTVLENYWEREKPIYPTGQIELQNHGNTLYFRNVFLREIPRPADAVYPLRPLKKGARVAVVGDSITEQKLYSKYVECYLAACLADLELKVIQLGWSGERAPGFADRLENDLLPWKPDVVTTCYGMNDGSYRAYEDGIGKAYQAAMRDIVSRLKKAGAAVVVGSPGAVDTFTFRMKKELTPAIYNANLSRLRDLARQTAREEGMLFADVHDAMARAMARAKPALGDEYHVCGGDGFHPGPNGQLAMAYAFLKGLGTDGRIGHIEMDLKGKASASGGHQVLSSSAGMVEVESARWPFCFPVKANDEKSPDSPRSILPFLPFQEELNRFTLVVKNLGAEKGRVTWGEESRTFSRGQLEAGINLAAEFHRNPFSAPFARLDSTVAAKQAFETTLIKEVITRFRAARGLLADDAEGKAALDRVRERLFQKQEELAAKVRAAVEPVRHTIAVAPEA